MDIERLKDKEVQDWIEENTHENVHDLAFKKSPFDDIPMRFYKTGDLCSRDEDGDILYYGRLDYQVKIR